MRDFVLSNGDGFGTNPGKNAAFRKWNQVAEPDQEITRTGKKIIAFKNCLSALDFQLRVNQLLTYLPCSDNNRAQEWSSETWDGKWNTEWGTFDETWTEEVEEVIEESSESVEESSSETITSSSSETIESSEVITTQVVNQVNIIQRPVIKRIQINGSWTFKIIRAAKVSITRKNGQQIVKSVRNVEQLERLDQQVRRQQITAISTIKTSKTGKSITIIRAPTFGWRFFKG